MVTRDGCRMKKVSYVGDSFITSDAVADALLDLTAALGRTGGSDAVEVPTVDGAGAADMVRLVLGPASQLVAAPHRSDFPEPDHGDAVEDLLARTRLLGPIHAVVASDQGAGSDFDLDDLEAY